MGGGASCRRERAAQREAEPAKFTPGPATDPQTPRGSIGSLTNNRGSSLSRVLFSRRGEGVRVKKSALSGAFGDSEPVTWRPHAGNRTLESGPERSRAAGARARRDRAWSRARRSSATAHAPVRLPARPRNFAGPPLPIRAPDSRSAYPGAAGGERREERGRLGRGRLGRGREACESL